MSLLPAPFKPISSKTFKGLKFSTIPFAWALLRLPRDGEGSRPWYKVGSKLMQGCKKGICSKKNIVSFLSMIPSVCLVQISIISQQRKGCLLKGLAFGNTSISKISKNFKKAVYLTSSKPGLFQKPWVRSSNKSDFLTLGLSPKRLYLCQQGRLGWNLPPRICNKGWLQHP